MINTKGAPISIEDMVKAEKGRVMTKEEIVEFESRIAEKEKEFVAQADRYNGRGEEA